MNTYKCTVVKVTADKEVRAAFAGLKGHTETISIYGGPAYAAETAVCSLLNARQLPPPSWYVDFQVRVVNAEKGQKCGDYLVP